jgi:hypothetical protein
MEAEFPGSETGTQQKDRQTLDNNQPSHGRGYEAMNMIRKGQVRWVRGNDVRCQIRFIGKLFGLAA